jgi:hypothetical protein
MGDSGRIEYGAGYCNTSVDEKKFWSAIQKFTESFLTEAPLIPPEQKAYVDREAQSGNVDRLNRILRHSIYRMHSIRGSMENLNSHASNYLKNQKYLPIEKKMEFIGRSLMNVMGDEIEYEQIDEMVADLRSKNYYISEEALKSYWAISRSLRTSLVNHLICYGEKYPLKPR